MEPEGLGHLGEGERMKELQELDEELEICGCCDTEGVWKLIRDYLLSCTGDSIDFNRQHTLLCGDSDWSPLVYVFLCQMQRVGLTEHGTGIRCSWLTEKGRRVLAALTDENIAAYEKEKFDP